MNEHCSCEDTTQFNHVSESYRKYFLKTKNNPERIKDMDIFAISNMLQLFATDCYAVRKIRLEHYVDYNEAFIAYMCAGICDPELSAPSIRIVREHDYYSYIDFMKLLLRGYDLIDELLLDTDEMFKKYSEVDEQRWFEDETKSTFLRSNDPKFLNEKNHKILNTFSDVQLIFLFSILTAMTFKFTIQMSTSMLVSI